MTVSNCQCVPYMVAVIMVPFHAIMVGCVPAEYQDFHYVPRPDWKVFVIQQLHNFEPQLLLYVPKFYLRHTCYKLFSLAATHVTNFSVWPPNMLQAFSLVPGYQGTMSEHSLTYDLWCEGCSVDDANRLTICAFFLLLIFRLTSRPKDSSNKWFEKDVEHDVSDKKKWSE